MGVEVYDYNDQFIGYLHGETYYPILVPEIDAFVKFDLTGNVTLNGSIWYSGPDCTGDAYWEYRKDYRTTDILKLIGTKYYIINPHLVSMIFQSYFFDFDPPECVNTSQPISANGHPSTEINEFELPFNLPVALPLKYK